MKSSLRHLFLWIAVLLMLFAFITPASASESLQAKPANLSLEPLPPLVVGSHPSIVAHLTAEFGQPIRNQPIFIFINGQRKGESRTDSRGIAIIPLKYKFEAGTYRVLAVYPGIISIGVNRATAELDMVVEPARSAIYTVPPVPGIKFRLNNQTYVADAN